MVERRRISRLRSIQAEEHAKTTILGPVLEHVMGDFVGGGLQPCLKRFKPFNGTNLLQARTHEVQESKEDGFAWREMAWVVQLTLQQILKGNCPAHQIIVTEIEECRQSQRADGRFARILIPKTVNPVEHSVFPLRS